MTEPRTVRICRVLERSGPMTCAQLAYRLDVRKARIACDLQNLRVSGCVKTVDQSGTEKIYGFIRRPEPSSRPKVVVAPAPKKVKYVGIKAPPRQAVQFQPLAIYELFSHWLLCQRDPPHTSKAASKGYKNG